MARRKLMAFIGRREGFVTVAYPDGKHLAIGFGHNGPDVFGGDTINLERALNLFEIDLLKFERGLAKKLHVDLEPHEEDALLSAAYNLGLAGIEPVIRRINIGDKAGAMDALVKLCRVKGPKDDDPETPDFIESAGLKKRREAERRLFETGDYGDISKIPFWDGNPFKTKMQWMPFPEG